MASAARNAELVTDGPFTRLTTQKQRNETEKMVAAKQLPAIDCPVDPVIIVKELDFLYFGLGRYAIAS